MFAGFSARQKREHHERAWLAWHIAAIPRFKEFPTLNSLTGEKPKLQRQSSDELEAALRLALGMDPL